MNGRSALLSLFFVTSLLGLEGPAAARDTVKLAFIGPLTGGNSAVGLGGRNSAQLAVQQHNARPDAKYDFELSVLDDECKPNVGLQVATKAAADRSIIAGIAHYCSVVAIVTVDTYHKLGLPVVIWGAVLPDITYGNNYPEIHRVNGTMIDEGREAAAFLVEHGYKHVAVIYDTTDYGKGQNKYFAENLPKDGGEIIGSFPVGTDQQDLTTELTKIKELKPDVVYIAGLTPLGVRIRNQMDKLGLSIPVAGVSGIMNEGYLQGAGRLAEGTIAFHDGAPVATYPQGRAFLEAYAKAGFKEDPDAYGPFAYSAANLVMDAIEKVGPNRRKVDDELNKTAHYQALIGDITFDAHRQNFAKANAYVVQGGKWTFWAQSEAAKKAATAPR